jgi:hypothetical protein
MNTPLHVNLLGLSLRCGWCLSPVLCYGDSLVWTGLSPLHLHQNLNSVFKTESYIAYEENPDCPS